MWLASWYIGNNKYHVFPFVSVSRRSKVTWTPQPIGTQKLNILLSLPNMVINLVKQYLIFIFYNISGGSSGVLALYLCKIKPIRMSVEVCFVKHEEGISHLLKFCFSTFILIYEQMSFVVFCLTGEGKMLLPRFVAVVVNPLSCVAVLWLQVCARLKAKPRPPRPVKHLPVAVLCTPTHLGNCQRIGPAESVSQVNCDQCQCCGLC